MIQPDIISIMLHIVATPIGNLQDITMRALDTLKQVDSIICEDTRRTGILLNHFQIPKKPLTVLNDYNENRMVPELISHLQGGSNLALVSDAGTPLISDPGYKLVRECLHYEIAVDFIPGPDSVTAALVLSGLPPDKFTFLGYLPEKPSARIKLFQSIKDSDKYLHVTYIAFIAPHKVSKAILDIKEVLGDIEVVLAQELTKIHQQINLSSVSDWIARLQKQPLKGELVLLFSIPRGAH